MKKILIFGILLFEIINTNAQTLIARSSNPEATANHNQRKIVRDSSENIYVVFTDSLDQKSVIKGVKYNKSTDLWNNASYLFTGKNPTLSISKDGEIHIVYESNDSLSRILYANTHDFTTWTPSIILSDTLVCSSLPVADVDSSGGVNIFWLEKNDGLNNSLMYANILNDTLTQIKSIITKNKISDIAIANHLQYSNNNLFFAIQFNIDSVSFYKSSDNMLSVDTVLETIGSHPCITLNFYYMDEDCSRFLYLDKYSNLMEVESNYWGTSKAHQLNPGTIDNICIDDIAPPIGYSYLFRKNDTLYHGFSYGSDFRFSTILDTIVNNPFNPSIAYKSFNFYNVDYVWMEDASYKFNIFYKRDPKYNWMGSHDLEKNKGFTLTGYPNPFSEVLKIKVSVNDSKESPQIKIYDSNSKLINVLKPIISSSKDYEYSWSGLNFNGDKINSGIYVITCSVGDNKTAKKIVFMSK